MKIPAIIDLIVAAGLLLFMIWGAKRGLFRALAGLVIVIAALVGASLIASTFSAPAAKLLSPLVEQHIENRVEGLVAAEADAAVDMPEITVEPDALSLEQLLELLGLNPNFTQSLAQEAQAKIQDTGVSIAMAVVESLAQSVIHALLFGSSFFVLLLLLNVLMRAMDLVLKLPGLHLLNGIGGAAFGLVEGTVLLFLALWLVQRCGYSVEKLVGDSVLLGFFTTYAPFDALSLLQ